jgi:C4-dicarboxylate-binding protein DctP
MVSNTFWTRLPPDLQALMTNTWAENIGAYRASMAAAQDRARGTLESHGVKFTDVTPEQATEVRNQMLQEQDQVAKDLKVSPEIVKLMAQDIATAA